MALAQVPLLADAPVVRWPSDPGASTSTASPARNSINAIDISQRCGKGSSWSPPFNASGTLALDLHQHLGSAFKKPWYLTVALKDGTPWYGEFRAQRYLTSYVTVPDELVDGAYAISTRLCLYMFEARNTTAEPNKSCNKVLSSNCKQAIKKWLASSTISKKCPDFDILPSCGSMLITTVKPNNLTSYPCDRHGIAGVKNIPENYTSRGFFGMGFQYGDAKNKFDHYDAHTKQSTPLVAVIGFQNETLNTTIFASSAHCIVPGRIAEGSRNPASLGIDLRASKATLALAVAASLLQPPSMVPLRCIRFLP